MTVLGPRSGSARPSGIDFSPHDLFLLFYILPCAQSPLVPDLKLWYSKISISRALALETRS